jgi:hypothetical protein
VTWDKRHVVTFPNGERHGYKFTDKKWFDYFIGGWKAKGYKIVQEDK